MNPALRTARSCVCSAATAKTHGVRSRRRGSTTTDRVSLRCARGTSPRMLALWRTTTRVRATVNGAFDLGLLEKAAATQRLYASVRATGLETLATDREFSARLQAVLGIGAAGSGAKAISLLARIQAGQQITTVDDLYKKLVLEEPETMATADAVVAHFDELESTRTRMLTREAAGERARADPRDQGQHRRGRRTRAGDRRGRRLHRSLLARRALERAAAPGSAARGRGRAGGSHPRAQPRRPREARLVDAADLEREGLLDVLRQSGGDRLETAQRELRVAERRLEDVRRERAKFDAIAEELGVEVETAAQFDAFVAGTRGSSPKSDIRDARAAFADAETARRTAEAEMRSLRDERERTIRVRGSIPAHLDESRALLAQAVGLAPSDLRRSSGTHRSAHGVRAMARGLQPRARRLREDASDRRRASGRVPFRHQRGAHPGTAQLRRRPDGAARDAGRRPEDAPSGGSTTCPTSFTGWLQQRLQERFGYVCVDSSSQLGAHQRALTISGQVSQGSRGAHGGQGRANMLGFSPTTVVCVRSMSSCGS